MRVLAPETMVPRQLREPTPEELERAMGLVRTARSRGARARLDWVLFRFVQDAADREWLAANLPVGTVFDHLGAATCMVVGHEYGPRGDELRPKHWRALVDLAGEGGLERRALTVGQLRAMLEPGYVMPARRRP